MNPDNFRALIQSGEQSAWLWAGMEWARAHASTMFPTGMHFFVDMVHWAAAEAQIAKPR